MRNAVVICVIFASGLFAQTPLQRAVNLTRQGRYAEASTLLRGVAEPSDLNQRIALHRLKAAIASGLNDRAAALHEIQSALALAPSDPKLLLAVAVAELQAGKTEDALAHAEAAPVSATQQALTGDIHEKRGQFESAVQSYRSAITLAPDREQYRVALGLELIEHQSFGPAAETLRDAAPLFPKSAKIRALLGIAEYAEGYPRDATKLLEAAIAVDPGEQSAHAALAKIVMQSSAPASPRTLQYLCNWNRTVCAALHFREARANGNTALITKSIAALKLTSPEDAIGRCELGRAYESTGQVTLARKEMESCVRLDPSPQNHYRLGLIYRKLGLTDLAAKEMKEREAMLQAMSEQTALGLEALHAAAQTTR